VQFLHRDDGAGGTVLAEDFSIDGVHATPQADIRNVDRSLQHVTQIGAGGFQDFRDVLKCLLGLLFKRADSFFGGFGVEGELAGDKNKAIVDDCLA